MSKLLAHRRKAFTQGFKPSDIAGLDLWLDASDNSTVLDSSSNPAGDNVAVQTWQDKSGNSNHATQSNVSRQPFRRASEINGLDAIDFLGSPNFMDGTSDITPRQSEPKTFFFVCKPDTGTGLTNGGEVANMYLAAGDTGSGGNITCEISYRTNTRTWISSTPCSTSDANIITLTQSGSGNLHSVVSMWLNGASVTRTSGTDGLLVNKVGGYRIGASYDINFDFDGRICEVLVYDSELSTANRQSVESYLEKKWKPKLLDSYSGAAAAYSLRELSSAWAGQPVVQLYRSDGVTQDFTADEITNGTLTSFGGTQGVFVETWYDQSGSGFDLTTNATGTNKPRIYTGVSQTITEVNGRPAIEILSPYCFFNATNSISYNGGVSWYSVVDLNNVGNTRIWSDDITGVQGYTNFLTQQQSSGNGYALNDNGTGYKNITISPHATVQELSSFNFDDSNGNYVIARDGSSTTGTLSGWNGPIGTSGSANIGVGGSGNSQQVINGFYQELVVYPNDQSSNRVGIETDINNHYSIYP